MAYDEQYYLDKLDLIIKRFEERKNKFIQDIMNLAADFQDDAKAFKEEYANLNQKIEESKNESGTGK